MTEDVRTVVYDCVPVTLVHPRLLTDLTIIHLLLPRNHPAYRRKVVADAIEWLKRLRTWFSTVECYSVTDQLETFLRTLPFHHLNYMHVNTSKFDEWRNLFLTSEHADYDLRILFTLFPRHVNEELFGKDVHNVLMF